MPLTEEESVIMDDEVYDGNDEQAMEQQTDSNSEVDGNVGRDLFNISEEMNENVLSNNSDMEPEEDHESFKYLLNQFSEEWMNNEINHKVSKTASSEFWNIAKKYMFSLSSAFNLENKKKFPKFAHIRRKLVKEKVPRISLQTGYVHKTSQLLTIANDTEKTEVLQFPPDQFEKVFETATVKVHIHISTATFFLPRRILCKSSFPVSLKFIKLNRSKYFL